MKDPLDDRVVSIEKCPLAPQIELQMSRVYTDESECPDHELITQYLYEQGKLTKELAMELITRS